MKLQIWTDETIDQKTSDWLQSKGELWDVMPGVGKLEVNIDNLDELNKLISETQEEYNKNNQTKANIAYDLCFLEKIHNDNEDMYDVLVHKKVGI